MLMVLRRNGLEEEVATVAGELSKGVRVARGKHESVAVAGVERHELPSRAPWPLRSLLGPRRLVTVAFSDGITKTVRASVTYRVLHGRSAAIS